MSLAEYPRLDSPAKTNGRSTNGRKPSREHRYADIAHALGDEEAAEELREIARRMDAKRTEMSRFQDHCKRYDELYYPSTITQFGADHWPDDPNLNIPGKAHVSVNVYPVYVDVPASLQSVTPVENIAAADPRQEQNRELAAAVERVFFAWKEEVAFEVKAHKAAITKGLYGRSAAKVWYDQDLDIPMVSIIDQPKNLWLGWGSTDYNSLDWAIYAYRLHPDTVMERYGLDVNIDEWGYQYVMPFKPGYVWDHGSQRDWLTGDEDNMVEVIDYWYRRPKDTPVPGEPTEMMTRNCIFVGNYRVKEEDHPEYGGKLPFVPVFNTYVPGVPDGRSEFFDIEQLIREKDERLSAGAQMIGKTVGGQFWQLTGQEAPDKVPAGLQPQPDKVVAPGAGNRIESIDPWMPQFQFNDYLDRIDRELADVSGLNDLLRGMAPSQVLSSGKAINALVANYEARIRIRRDLFYEWRRSIWELAVTTWSYFNEELGSAFQQAARLTIKPPSLTPRDELETATMAANNVNNKTWSLRRGMEAVGVEDPEAEIDIIKEERTDAALFPADVQTQAALASTLQQLQMTQQQVAGQMGAEQQMASPAGSAMEQLAMQAAQGSPDGMTMFNAPGEQGVMPPEAMAPGATPPGAMPITGPGFNAMAQTQIKGGEPSNRLLYQQPLGAPPAEGP